MEEGQMVRVSQSQVKGTGSEEELAKHPLLTFAWIK